MVDNRHCPDHCELIIQIARVDENVKYIREKIVEKKSDFKWVFVTMLSVVSVVIAIWKH
jgi:hypothetical protein